MEWPGNVVSSSTHGVMTFMTGHVLLDSPVTPVALHPVGKEVGEVEQSMKFN